LKMTVAELSMLSCMAYDSSYLLIVVLFTTHA